MKKTTDLAHEITTRIRRRPLQGPAAGLNLAAAALIRWNIHLGEVELALTDEIERRGGETGINHAPSQGCAASRTEWRRLHIVDVAESEAAPVYLLRASGWRYYSRRFGSRPAALAYVGGYDDNGPWAARVPGTIKTAAEAIEWITPKEVVKARAAGRRVLRQGDVYAVEIGRRYDGAGTEPGAPQLAQPVVAGADSHEWHHRARVLIHTDADRPHPPLVVPFPARFVTQRAYQMGRTSRRGSAD